MSTRTRPTSRPFKLVKIMPAIQASHETLFKAISMQNPAVDPDGLFMGLQDLARRFGSGDQNAPSMATTASLAGLRPPPYSLTADLLGTAFKKFGAGDTKGALETFAAAMEVPDAGRFFRSIAIVNAMSAGSEEKDTEVTLDPAHMTAAADEDAEGTKKLEAEIDEVVAGMQAQAGDDSDSDSDEDDKKRKSDVASDSDKDDKAEAGLVLTDAEKAERRKSNLAALGTAA